ncbi:MAG: CDP-alcohol phosphatidyltransferase family protein [Candidatus Poribacteria bacterium]|nr:CDP-alcohol phosphatidyltransferase family protein [Candidatus Poribacteria bacterium]
MQIIRRDFVYVSNLLSLSRLVLAPFIYLSIVHYERTITLALGSLAVLTDLLDGYVARRFKLPSDLGKILDPIADKLVIGAALFGLVHSKHYDFPLWVFGLVVIRDVFIIVGSTYLAYQVRFVTRSNRWGKCATVFLSIALILYVVDFAGSISFYVLCAGLVFIVISSWSYARRLIRLLQTHVPHHKKLV